MLGQVRFRDDFAVAMSTVTEFLGALNDEIIQQRRLGNIKWSSGRFLIEDQANGPAAISTWNASGIPAGLALEPVNPGTKSKLARAEACLATVRSGNVWLPSPKSKAHYEGMLERVTTFPRSKTDDEVDAMTQYLLFNLEEDFNVSRMMSNLKGLAEGLKLANSRTSW